jgi:hypothetical protein
MPRFTVLFHGLPSHGTHSPEIEDVITSTRSWTLSSGEGGDQPMDQYEFVDKGWGNAINGEHRA